MKYKTKQYEVEAYHFGKDVTLPDWLVDAIHNKTVIFNDSSCIIISQETGYFETVCKNDYIVYDGEKIYSLSQKKFEEKYEKI